jgi:hypothetical protein
MRKAVISLLLALLASVPRDLGRQADASHQGLKARIGT